MKYYFKSKSKKYLLATILLLSLCPLLGLTYSSFIFSSDNYRASEMYIGTLMYGIKINDESVSKITVEPGETEVNIEITSLNTVSSFYKLIYKENSNILVEYNEETTDLPSGDISNTRTITIKITNSSSSNIEVEFDVASGYITNDLNDIKIKTGYIEIKDFYEVNKTDIQIALKIDGETVSSIPQDKYYKLSSYVCEKNSLVEYNTITKTIVTYTKDVPEKCTLEFVEADTIGPKIIADNPNIINDSTSLFSGTSGTGLYRTTDLTKTEDTNADGVGEEVLYFRGAVTNNYLVFAGYCWRIVRTNESGESIKLRYGGEATINDQNAVCPQTGTVVMINDTIYSFNTALNNKKYVGYVYDENVNSQAKTQVETWYANKIESQGDSVTNLIVDEPYCNDTSYTTSGSYIYYGAYKRLSTNKNPQYKCPNATDKYTINTSKGNGKLSKPVALLTADEVAYAGGVYNEENTSYYLYTLGNYWTMSPLYFNGSSAYGFNVISSGALSNPAMTNTFGLLPVISLSINSIISSNGNGTFNNPYIIVTE